MSSPVFNPDTQPVRIDRFKDKRILVTGGAGGIGQTVVRRFVAEGAHVLFTDRDAANCQQLVDDLPTDAPIFFETGDLAEQSFCEGLVASTIERLGGIDILVNNAGIIPRGTILETTDEMWFSALNINLNAVFFLCRAAIPAMQQAGGGAIVNTSSTWGIYPGPGHLAYCTSKAAVAALTRNLGRDHAGDGIRVNAVCPNEVNTPMLRGGFERRGFDPDTAIQALNQTVPLGRIAEPEEIASVIAFLASDDASYICGETIEISGAKPVYG